MENSVKVAFSFIRMSRKFGHKAVVVKKNFFYFKCNRKDLEQRVLLAHPTFPTVILFHVYHNNGAKQVRRILSIAVIGFLFCKLN